jgi:prevent-host-death family protein
MRQFNIREAKAQLSNLVEIAIAGEEVIIAKAGTPMVRLVPMGRASAPRKKGLLEGRIKIGPEFDQPLCDAVIASFEGRSQP